jgi:aryl-alcohol dehydrogenase-like predicted oxidoreductase
VSAQGDDVVPIPGTRRRAYLDENLGAEDVTQYPRRPGAHRRRRAAPVPPRACATTAAMMGAIAR